VVVKTAHNNQGSSIIFASENEKAPVKTEAGHIAKDNAHEKGASYNLCENICRLKLTDGNRNTWPIP